MKHDRVGAHDVRLSHMNRHTFRALMALVVLSAFTPLAAQQTEGDAARGEKLFEECSSCHATKKDAEPGVGPGLFGLIDRKAGDLADFRYSPALRRSGLTWTPMTLDEFLADPQKSVPANRMPYAGLTDPQARADVIAYLRKVTK